MSSVRQPSISSSPSLVRKLTTEQEPFLAVRSLATNYASGYRIESHHHKWHQFLYATSGAMTLSTTKFSWMIPAGGAVFIPAHDPHTIRMWGIVQMRTLYFSPTLTDFQAQQCQVVDVCPLLRELILRTTELIALDTRVTRDSYMVAMLQDEIKMAIPAATGSLGLPLPTDEHALIVAQEVLRCPLNVTPIDELAQRHGIAKRTLERRFHDETGMSFGIWRQKARLLNSIRLLAEGKSVTDAALDSGYTSISAFIAAFKSTFGYTPGRI